MAGELILQRGDRFGRGTVTGGDARITVPRGDAEQEIVVASDFAPDVLARLNDLGPRPRPEPFVPLQFTAADFASVLAAGDPAAPALYADHEPAAERFMAGFREHWRVEVSWKPDRPGRAVEVVDTDGGLWLVIREGSDVELRPTTPSAVWRLLILLICPDDDLRYSAVRIPVRG